MTATNPHPLANPLNRHRYAAYEMGMPAKHVMTHCSDPSKLEVPEPTTSFDQAIQMQNRAQDSLHVLYTAPDDICSTSTGSFGFIGNSTMFKLHDGSILDLKTHKIVLDPNKKFKAAGYWDDPSKQMSRNDGLHYWGKTESIESLLAAKGEMGDAYDPNLSPESHKYWQMAQAESKNLMQHMTDEQKQLMKQLEDESFFPLSKLKEEN